MEKKSICKYTAMKENHENLHKEIEIIQSVINRMASNSFYLKGWLISIIVVLIGLSSDSLLDFSNQKAFILYLPLLSFWYLDAFFLHKERCYVKLYNWTVSNRENTNDYLYDLNYKRFENEVDSVFSIMFSKTLFSFYGIVFVCLGIASVIAVVD